jgi:glycosyltransferase involved in cell wall biosynthesis
MPIAGPSSLLTPDPTSCMDGRNETIPGQKGKPRVAVVSPFLDRQHGTERIVLEWISRLTEQFEIHVYSQHVEDADLSRVVWHRIPKLRGPLLFNFLWWFTANHLWRAWDHRVRRLRHDLVFSPGVNCLDADAVSVHIVFAEFLRCVRRELEFRRNPVRFWPRLLHRRLYYRLVIALERVVYRNPDTTLIHMARKTATSIERIYQRRDSSRVIYVGLDHTAFNPARCSLLRSDSRKELGLCTERFALLMIGNDWHNKGIRALLEALVPLHALPIDLLVVGSDNPAPFLEMALSRGLKDRIRFLPPRKDVEFYYAAADAYAGPSLEDAYSLPPSEAMACGLPVIVSSACGVSEIITDGSDGLVLADPTDAGTLAALIRKLYSDKEFRTTIGRKAAETAKQYTWDRNARELSAILAGILQEKGT